MSATTYPVDRKALEAYTFEELVQAHKFYMHGPKENLQCQRMLGAIEFMLVEIACAGADVVLAKYAMELI